MWGLLSSPPYSSSKILQALSPHSYSPLKVAPYVSDEGRDMFAVFTANEVQISFADSMYDTAFFDEADAKSAKDYIEDKLQNDAE